MKDYSGEFAYLDGDEVKNITCKSEKLLTKILSELSVGLYEQMMWYKLPFEDHN